MDAIVLFSHGSLLCGSGQALTAHAERLREREVAPIVEVGYLNYCTPEFSEAVDRCVGAGANRILVTPYFLVPGYFVNVALPKCIAAAREKHPGICFSVAAPIGYDDRLADALISSAEHARDRMHWRDDLSIAPEFCRTNPACPLYATLLCPNSPLQVHDGANP